MSQKTSNDQMLDELSLQIEDRDKQLTETFNIGSTETSGNTSHRSSSADHLQMKSEDGSNDEEIVNKPLPKSKSLTFDEHMWDKLPEIEKHSQQGSKMLQEFSTFCKNYNTALQKFGNDVNKHFESFIKNISKENKKGILDNNYFSSKKFGGKDKPSEDEESHQFSIPHAMSLAIDQMKITMNQQFKIIEERVNLIVGDLVEPLEMYIGHHDQTSSQQFKQASKLYFDLLEKQANHQEAKRQYMNLGHESEQMEIEIEKALLNQEQGDISVEKVQEVMNQSLNTKYKVQTALKVYKDSIKDLNQAQFEMENDYKPILQQMQQYEESRINFTKYNFDKFIKHITALGKKIQDHGTESQKQIQATNNEIELNTFIQKHITSTSFPCDEIKFEPFVISDDLLRYKQFLAEQTKELKAQSENKLQEIMDIENTKHQLFEVIQNIIYHRKVTDKTEEEIVPTKQELSKLILAFHEKDTRMKITEILKMVGTPVCVVSLQGLQTLGELIKYLLTAIIHEKDVNFKVIYAILNSSQQIYYQPFKAEEQENKSDTRSQRISQKLRFKKQYLTQFVNDHGIWQEENIWKSVLQKVLNQKFQEAVQKEKDRRANNEEDGLEEYKSQVMKQASNFMGNINYFGKSFKGSLWGGEKSERGDGSARGGEKSKGQTMRIPKVLAQNIIFNTISNFMFHFINFKYSLENSKEVILYFCKRYELDQSRTHLLLSELESAQNQAHLVLTSKELQQISKDKISKRSSYGKLMIIQQALKFIGPYPNDQALINFLLLNKECNSKLEKQVLKQALIYEINPVKLNKKRVYIWKKILGINKNNRDYYAFRDKVCSKNQQDRLFEDDGEIYQTQALKNSVSELIAMDVQRSFHNLRHIVKPEILNNVLKTYAFFNPEIEYCQGMNFVAGFLFLVFRDEQVSFNALMRVAEIFDMSLLYKKELPMLKLFFYQLDRLIAIQLPHLHQHFKDEQINSGIFASAWFITQFTNSLQIQDKNFNKNKDQKLIDENDQIISDNLLQLWDYFISSGWKSMFKMSLFILKTNETKLLSMGFEDILNQISDQPKQILSHNCMELNALDDYGVFEDSTIYMRFKKDLQKDDEGQDLHIDFLMSKFKKEFDDQMQQAEVRKKQQNE